AIRPEVESRTGLTRAAATVARYDVVVVSSLYVDIQAMGGRHVSEGRSGWGVDRHTCCHDEKLADFAPGAHIRGIGAEVGIVVGGHARLPWLAAWLVVHAALAAHAVDVGIVGV